MSIGKNIALLRKEKGWTQAELGEILGVSNQAVSKWESEMTMPDIMMLPALAEVFGCSVDALFSDRVQDPCSWSLPWEDDDTVRCAVFRGKTVLQFTDGSLGRLCYADAADITCTEGNVIIIGNVEGDCTARGSIFVNGNISGDCTAQENIEAKGQISGDCSANGDIIAGGNISGECNAKGMIYTPDGKTDKQSISFS